MLEQTLEILERAEAHALASRISESLETPPLAKPSDHKAGRATDMFVLEIELAEAQDVAGWMSHAVRQRWTTSGTRSRGLGGFVEAWMEYVSFKEHA